MNVTFTCDKCGITPEPIWFTEHEVKNGVETGRIRKAVDVLVCPCCLKEYCVDDSYDGPWIRP